MLVAKPRTYAGIAALILSAVALYILRIDDVAGIIGDDAWYVVLARAIAEGHGPRLISSAGTEFLSTVYPPGFPAILSLVFLVSPQFPDNMALLKGVSIAAMIGAGVLTFSYAAHHRHLPRAVALVVAIATVLTPALVFLATSTLMSEPVFLFIQLGAVLLVERTARALDDRVGSRLAVIATVAIFRLSYGHWLHPEDPSQDGQSRIGLPLRPLR